MAPPVALALVKAGIAFGILAASLGAGLIAVYDQTKPYPELL